MRCFVADNSRQRFGRIEVAFEELDEGQQPERPAHAIAIAEPVVGIGGVGEPLASECQIAGQECDPGPVLLDVGEAAFVGEGLIELVGLAEEPFRLAQ